MLILFTTGYAQTPDKAKLDQFFDRLGEKNKGMGTLVSDGPVVKECLPKRINQVS